MFDDNHPYGVIIIMRCHMVSTLAFIQYEVVGSLSDTPLGGGCGGCGGVWNEA